MLDGHPDEPALVRMDAREPGTSGGSVTLALTIIVRSITLRSSRMLRATRTPRARPGCRGECSRFASPSGARTPGRTPARAAGCPRAAREGGIEIGKTFTLQDVTAVQVEKVGHPVPYGRGPEWYHRPTPPDSGPSRARRPEEPGLGAGQAHAIDSARLAAILIWNTMV
jgi:hypothetical protein